MPFHESVPMRLRRAYLTVHRAAQAHFAQFGVTADQYVLLSLLADQDGITQKELAARMCSDGNTVTAMLRRLEGKALIRRERCDADGRARRVHLTKAGRQLQRKLVGSAKPLHERMDKAVAAGGCAAFFDCLDRIAEVVTAAETGTNGKPRRRRGRPAKA